MSKLQLLISLIELGIQRHDYPAHRFIGDTTSITKRRHWIQAVERLSSIRSKKRFHSVRRQDCVLSYRLQTSHESPPSALTHYRPESGSCPAPYAQPYVVRTLYRPLKVVRLTKARQPSPKSSGIRAGGQLATVPVAAALHQGGYVRPTPRPSATRFM